MTTRVQAVLSDIEACNEARRWCAVQHQSAAYLWKHCRNPKWMLYLVAALEHPKLDEILKLIDPLRLFEPRYDKIKNHPNVGWRGVYLSCMYFHASTRDNHYCDEIRKIIPDWDWSK
jgi:hypothetical protein